MNPEIPEKSSSSEIPEEATTPPLSQQEPAEGETPVQPVSKTEGPPEDLDAELDAVEEPDPEMEAMLESSLEVPQEGSIMTGTILSVRSDEVVVAIGGKSEGVIPLAEFESDRKDKELEYGQTYDLLYKGFRDGQPSLSRREARRLVGQGKIEEATEKGTPVKALVTSRTKGGLKVEVEGIQGFMPFSQSGVRRGKEDELEALIGQHVQAMIVEAPGAKGKDLVVSRRACLDQKAQQAKEKALDRLRVGDRVKGKVKHLTKFGAFIDLDGVDGLLHVKDMAWGHVDKPETIVQVGQEIETLLLSIEDDKVALGLKQMSEDPWESVETRYSVGTRVEGTISSLTKYGAFVELETGVEGLIHISEMSWTKRLRHPSELLKVGDRVEVAVLSIDKEKQRIGLGYKQTREDPWEKVVTECPEGSAVTGKVVSLTNFGAFVSLAEGVDGMVHVSDLSWGKKVNHPSQVLREGDLVEARVLKIDRENRKISLGLKQARPDPWKEVPDRYPVGTLVEATVTSLTDFGAFAEIEPGLEGLIHISELSADRVEKVSDVLSVGQKITAAVTKIDQEARRIGLSVRAGQEREAVRNQVNIQAEVESEGKSIAAGLSDFGQLLNAALEKDRKGSD